MTTIIFKNIPLEIYRTFKSKCAANGITMKDAFIQFMIEFCK